MNPESEILQAINNFTRAIGSPNALICDVARAQKSATARKFCNEVGPTL